MVISADIFAVLLRYFWSSIGNLIINVIINLTTEINLSMEKSWKGEGI